MRGKVKIPVVVGYKNRIPPAYAGKSVGACFKAGKHEDHPRLCGEKVFLFLGVIYYVWDHPRLCGEKKV